MTPVHSRCHGLVYIGSLLARDVARTHCRRSSSWSSTFSFIIVHADRRRCRPGLSWPLSSALSALPASPARDIHRDIHRAYRSNVNIIWPLIDRFRICVCIYRRSSPVDFSRWSRWSVWPSTANLQLNIISTCDSIIERQALMYQHAHVSALWRRLCAVFVWLREGHSTCLGRLLRVIASIDSVICVCNSRRWTRLLCRYSYINCAESKNSNCLIFFA